MAEKTKSVALETAYREILALADKYDRTEVAEYEGQLHIRTGRKVVAVFDVFEGTVRVNTVETPEQRARVNEVLEIVAAMRRITVIEQDIPAIKGKVEVPCWTIASSEYSDHILTAFTPREVFTLAYLESPLADEYATWDEDEDGEVTVTPQPARSWIQDNLRDISESEEEDNE